MPLFGHFGFKGQAFSAQVLDWKARILAAGGTVSQNSMLNAQAFYMGLMTNGLLAKMKFVNCFAPDNVNACMVPLIKANKDICTGINLSTYPQDVSIMGYGARSAGDIQTGFIPSLHYSSNTNVGVSIYLSTSSGGSNGYLLAGSYNSTKSASDQAFRFVSNNLAKNLSCELFSSSAMAVQTYSSGQFFRGYISAGRRDANTIYLHRANAARPTLVSTVNSASPLGALVLPAGIEAGVGTAGLESNGWGGVSPGSIGFAAFHDALTDAESQILYGLVQSLRYGFFTKKPKNNAVAAWRERAIINNGGYYTGTVSDSTIDALDTFYSGLVSSGLVAKMRYILPFVPDNFQAAITPLIRSDGGMSADVCANPSGIPATNLSVNGFIFPSGGMQLATGFYPVTDILNNNNAACTAYITSLSGAAILAGASYAANNSFLFKWDSTAGSAIMNCWSDTNSYTTAIPSAWRGYLSMGRSDSSTMYAYRANSTTAHTAASGTAVIGTSAPDSLNNSTVALNYDRNHTATGSFTCSFFALHDALTAAESQIFYDLIQQLRMSLGGGYI